MYVYVNLCMHRLYKCSIGPVGPTLGDISTSNCAWKTLVSFHFNKNWNDEWTNSINSATGIKKWSWIAMFSLPGASLSDREQGETVQIHREWKSSPSTTLAFQKRAPFLFAGGANSWGWPWAFCESSHQWVPWCCAFGSPKGFWVPANSGDHHKP